MFAIAKVSAAVLALASFAQATITISQPTITGNSTNTISWTSSDPSNDPESFSIELINSIFNTQFALANNVPTTQGKITFELPVVPPTTGYTIQFVDIGNINNVFAQTGSFSVIEHDVSSTPSATATLPGSSGVASGTIASHSTTPSVGTITQQSPSAVTISPTTPLSTASSTGSASSAGSSSSPAATPFNSNPNAAAGLAPTGSFAALLVSIIALLI